MDPTKALLEGNLGSLRGRPRLSYRVHLYSCHHLISSLRHKKGTCKGPKILQCREFFKRAHLKKKKTGNKRALFQPKNGRFQDFLFHFFLWVFTVLLYLLVYVEIRLSITRPRKPLKLKFRQFNVINYQHGLINVKCRQNHKKTGKFSKKTGEKRAIFPKCPFKRACPFKNGRLLYTDFVKIRDWGGG